MSKYFYGQFPVSANEALLSDGTLKPGYRMVTDLMMKDADTPASHVSRSGVGYSPATAARQRAADAERYRQIGAAVAPTQGVRAVGDGRAVLSPAQAAYEKRVADAWKQTDDLPERRPHADGVKPKAAPVADRKPGVVATSASQSAYEARLTNAWRAA